jgi:hypothetical protein
MNFEVEDIEPTRMGRMERNDKMSDVQSRIKRLSYELGLCYVELAYIKALDEANRPPLNSL